MINNLSAYPQLNNKKWLYEKYIIDNLSALKISKIIGCSNWSVLIGLKRCNIKIKSQIANPLLENKQWLIQKYIKENLSTIKIGKKLNISSSAVGNALKRFNIIRREANTKFPILKNKELLYQKYIIEKLSTKEIGKLFNTESSNILRALVRHNIPRRDSIKYELLKDREWLHEKYIIKRLSPSEIGKIVGTSSATVRNAIIRNNIPRRGRNYKYPILDDKKWLHEKYIKETLSLKRIGKIVGTKGSNVRNYLIKYNIPLRESNERTGNAHKRLTHKYSSLDDKDWLYFKYVAQGLSTKNIAETVKAKDCNSVRQSLIRHDIPVRNISDGLTYRRKDDYFIFNKEVIEGCLLGDASLGIYNRHSDISVPWFHKKNIYWEHVVFVASKLFSENVGSRIKFSIDFNNKLKNGKYASNYSLSTISHKELISLYKIWYPKWNNYEKVIPENINVTPIVMLHWFLDDGFSYRRRLNSNTKQIYIEFCSECFKQDNQEMLANKINKKFNLHCSVKKRSSNPSGKNYRIVITQKYTQLFYEIIGPSPIVAMAYKWK